MNNYKFRGKTTEHGEWMYGFYIEGLSSYTGDIKYCIVQKDENIGDYTEFTNILPETVGQWTGLLDKNGKEIYEGDIIKTQEYSDRPFSKKAKFKRHIGVVKFRVLSGKFQYSREEALEKKCESRYLDYLPEWYVKIKDYGKYGCHSWSAFFDCEVVGNIHDNPELLEGK